MFFRVMKINLGLLAFRPLAFRIRGHGDEFQDERPAKAPEQLFRHKVTVVAKRAARRAHIKVGVGKP